MLNTIWLLIRCHGKGAFAVCSLKVVKLKGLCSFLIVLDFDLKSAAGKKIFLKEVWYTTWSGIKTLWSVSWATEKNHLPVEYLWMKSDGKYRSRERYTATECHTVTEHTQISLCVHSHTDVQFHRRTAVTAWQTSPIIKCFLASGSGRLLFNLFRVI